MKHVKNLLGGLIILSFILSMLVSCSSGNEPPIVPADTGINETPEYTPEIPTAPATYNIIDRDYDWFVVKMTQVHIVNPTVVLLLLLWRQNGMTGILQVQLRKRERGNLFIILKITMIGLRAGGGRR